MNWMEEIDNSITEKIRNAGQRVIIIPSSDPIVSDSVDVYDGETKKIVAANVPEKNADEYVRIWNGILNNGESPRKINIAWLAGISTNRTYER